MNTKECWTARELWDECERIKKMIGPNAEIFVSVSVCRYETKCEKPASVSVYPNGIQARREDHESFRAATWGEAFAAAEKYASTAKDIAASVLVRRMALAIIDITDRLGACSDLNLKAEKFESSEIAAYHIRACEAASRMSGNAPFVVLMSVSAAA